ncbi:MULTISPECIES: hypothetical protein [Streptomyces]|uniref:Lipoprotein n=1 Tax=Streptomyces viridochromogenes TaxID=1938 RepID=A0A0L8L0R0_STRVR|nr:MULTISPECIES: hypothetical protein [Streptomyces]KOG31686.1 hypothetical protein ADK34_10010 [Streptomyces viridochromogenes]
MRTRTRFVKIVMVAALGGMALSACGTEGSAGKPPAKASAIAATAPAKPKPTPARSLPSDELATNADPEARFMALFMRVLDGCVPGGLPQPPAVPEAEEEPTRGAGAPPTPSDADLPVSPLPPEPVPTRAGPVDEVPLTASDKCAGDAHAQRIRAAFDGAGPADQMDLRKELAALDYPPTRIHPMPDHGGSPRARIDLRFMGNNLVLEVTGTGRGVVVEAFGAPETEDVDITKVKRKPALDAPTA